jgi:hypothetical protein
MSAFLVKLKLEGMSESGRSELISDLTNELNKRSHLENPKVYYSDEEKGILVEMIYNGSDKDIVGKAVQEEIWEIIPAYSDEVGWLVKIVSVAEKV